jgi:hypothetical protein
MERQIFNIAKYFGIKSATIYLLFKVINKICFFKIYNIISLTESQLNLGLKPARNEFEFRWLKEHDLKNLKDVEKYDLSIEFIEKSLSSGAECFGVYNGNQLVHYSWFTNNPNQLTDDLLLEFNNSYVYGFKAFTEKNYRGQSLFALIHLKVLNDFLQRGIDHIFGVIELNNFPSLKSLYKIGFIPVGKITVVRLLNKYYIYNSKNTKKQDFQIKQVKFNKN